MILDWKLGGVRYLSTGVCVEIQVLVHPQLSQLVVPNFWPKANWWWFKGETDSLGHCNVSVRIQDSGQSLSQWPTFTCSQPGVEAYSELCTIPATSKEALLLPAMEIKLYPEVVAVLAHWCSSSVLLHLPRHQFFLLLLYKGLKPYFATARFLLLHNFNIHSNIHSLQMSSISAKWWKSLEYFGKQWETHKKTSRWSPYYPHLPRPPCAPPTLPAAPPCRPRGPPGPPVPPQKLPGHFSQGLSRCPHLNFPHPGVGIESQMLCTWHVKFDLDLQKCWDVMSYFLQQWLLTIGFQALGLRLVPSLLAKPKSGTGTRTKTRIRKHCCWIVKLA